MMTVRHSALYLLTAVFLIVLPVASAFCAATAAGNLFTPTMSPAGVTFAPTASYDGVRLTVLAPDGNVFSTVFEGNAQPGISASILPGSQKDGYFTYELRVLKTTGYLQRGTDPLSAGGGSTAIAPPQIQNGHFLVTNGLIVVPGKKDIETAPTQKTHTSSAVPAPLDAVTADDAIITGSLCVGFDCLTDGTENFGFDTIKIKENNLRIFFDDTSSTAGFAANDWRIVVNDSSSGGGNYFAIEDSTAARTPFKIEAGARTSALYVSSTGRVGFGTATPVLNQHIAFGDTPAIRLDQDSSSGWTPQVWDIAGNESNFFIREVTGGSKLPFRIQPGAPTNSISVCASGTVVIGGWCQ